jgi:GT2 family glycosyltransferase
MLDNKLAAELVWETPSTRPSRRRVKVLILGYNTPFAAAKCSNAVWETAGNREDYSIDEQIYENFPENKNIHTIWNEVAKEWDGEYIAYLTADTFPTGEWLGRLLAAREMNKQILVVGPSTDNCFNEQSGRDPQTMVNAYGVVPGVLLAGFCMLVHQDAFKVIGGFREDYTLYAGDLDFMLRIRMAGYETAWVPDAFVYHEWGLSTKAKGDKWHTDARKLGQEQLDASIAEYNKAPGRWFWDGKECKRIEVGREDSV